MFRQIAAALVLGLSAVLSGGPAPAAPVPLPRGKESDPTKVQLRVYPVEVQRFDYLGMVDSVAFSPDGKSVAGTCVGRIYLWDVKTRAVLRQWRAPSGWSFINTVAFSPDGKTHAAGASTSGTSDADNSVVLWDIATGKRLRGVGVPASDCHGFAFAPTGKTLALASGGVSYLDAATGKRLWWADIPNVWGVAFSPDGKTLAALDINHVVTLWSTATGKKLAQLGGGGRNIAMYARLAFSPDGRRLAVRNPNCSVDLWDVQTRKKVRQLAAPRGRPRYQDGEVFSNSYVAFSPDGSVLVSGENGRTGAVLAVYDSLSGGELHQMGDQLNGFKCVAFSPDGSLLATGSVDGAGHLFGAQPLSEFLDKKPLPQQNQFLDRKVLPLQKQFPERKLR